MTTVVVLEVPMDCPGCEKKVRKALEKIKGVHDVQIDMKQQKVTVTGYAEQKKVIKVARSISGSREVCLWSYPYNPQSNGFNDRYLKKKHYMKNMSANGEKWSSYNYYKHGIHGHEHGYRQGKPYSGLVDDNTGSMFNDENPHFCSVM